MAIAQSTKTRKSHDIRQQEIQKRQIDVALRCQDVQRGLDRGGLENPGIRMRYPDGIAEGLAKQRMIIDDEEAHHESLVRNAGHVPPVNHSGMLPGSGLNLNRPQPPAPSANTRGRFAVPPRRIPPSRQACPWTACRHELPSSRSPPYRRRIA